jgi:hypothetical protein
VANKKLNQALDLLRRPDALLVQLHTGKGTSFFIWPSGGRISDEVARALLERNDVQPHDNGLLPGHPQSWKLGNWRSKARHTNQYAETFSQLRHDVARRAARIRRTEQKRRQINE